MTSGERPVLGLTPGIVRKLVAVLSADAEGYSRLMGLDESATLQTMMSHRATIDALVRDYRGRVVDSPGDNVLAEFPSVVDAVQCAVEIQRELEATNADLAPSRQLRFRIGINLGDVLVEGERIYGDGVNIAARLEHLADGGGICITRSVYEQVRTKLDLDYEDIGAQPVKNIAEPIRVYRVRDEPAAPGLVAIRRRLATTFRRRRILVAVAALLLLGGAMLWHVVWPSWLAPAVKPSVAVLPFANMSGETDQEYFSDGMTEDLITELSRLAGLLVIARNSVVPYKGKAVRPEQVSRELGVRYLVEGSVRKSNNKIRVTAQLIDATTGYHVWAQSYDRDLQDIFGVQAEIAQMITQALAVRLTVEERAHMGRPYTSSEVAWEYYRQGLELYRRFTPKDNAQGREMFERAIALDPLFARAYAALAATHRQDGNMEWSADRQISEDLAYRMAQRGVELARKELEPKPSLADALEQMGYVHLYRKELADARRVAEESIQRNPNFADGYALWAHVLIYSGEPEEALRKTEEATRRNPKSPFFYDYHRGHAYYVWGYLTSNKDAAVGRQHFEDAEKHLLVAVQRNPNFRPARAYRAAALVELGRRDEAKKEMDVLVKAGRPQASVDPDRFRTYIERSLPYGRDDIRNHLIDVWRVAEGGPAKAP